VVLNGGQRNGEKTLYQRPADKALGKKKETKGYTKNFLQQGREKKNCNTIGLNLRPLNK